MCFKVWISFSQQKVLPRERFRPRHTLPGDGRFIRLQYMEFYILLKCISIRQNSTSQIQIFFQILMVTVPVSFRYLIRQLQKPHVYSISVTLLFVLLFKYVLNVNLLLHICKKI